MKSRQDLYSIASINKTLTSVTIELNTSCNWRCQHCYIDDYTSTDTLSLEALDKLFGDLRNAGVVQILFTGGEIFLRDDIIEIIRLAREYFFNVSLFSNASLLDENLVKELHDMCIDSLSCTIFSMKDDIHDKITQKKGSLKKTLYSLELLHKYGVKVEVKHIIMKTNQYEYVEIAEYCEKMGFKFLATTSLMPARDNDSRPLSFAVDKQYLLKNLAQIDYYRAFSCHEKDENMYICNATRYSLFIQANGDIHPCNNHLKRIGNIFIDDINNIWKNSEYLNWLQDLKWKDLKFCSKCGAQNYCLRCSGIAFLEHQDVLGCNMLEKTNADTRKKLAEEGLENKVGKCFDFLC